MRSMAAIAMMAAVFLAGCSDSGGDSEVAALDGSIPEGSRISSPLEWPFAQVNLTQTIEGSFEVQESRQLLGRFQGTTGIDPGHVQVYEIEGVPVGAAVVVEAVIEAGVGEGDVDLWFGAQPGAFWTYACDCPYGGFSSVTSHLVLDGSEPLRLFVRYDEADDQPGFDFTVDVNVQAHPALIPSGVPVSASFTDASQELVFPGATAPIHVLGANGSRLTTLDGDPSRFDLDNRTLGTYTFIQEPAGEPTTLVLLSPEGTAAPAKKIHIQSIERTEEWAVQAGMSGQWMFDTMRTPLGAVLCFESEPGVVDPTVRLSGPNGALLEIDWQTSNEPLTATGFGFCTRTPIGDERLSAGEYQVVFEDQAGTGTTVFAELLYLG